MPFDLTSKHGPNIVFRGLTTAPKNGKAFSGVMGLSLAGGRGNGKSAPSVERSKPSVLTSTPRSSGSTVLCTVRVRATCYEVQNPEWSSPLSCPLQSSDGVFAVFFKGFKDVHVGIRVSLPQTEAGVTFAEMVAQTPLQAMQSRVDSVR